MKNFFDNLSEREQKLLIVCGIFLSIYIIYAFIVSPLLSYKKAKQDEYIEKQQTLVWMQEAQKNFKFSNKKVLTKQILLTNLATELKHGSLTKYSYQLRQHNSGEIELQFDKVPYVNFINWLLSFNKKFDFNIKKLYLQKGEGEGEVKVNLVINV